MRLLQGFWIETIDRNCQVLQKYPELSYAELYTRKISSEKIVELEHLPIYYGNLAERILPVRLKILLKANTYYLY